MIAKRRAKTAGINYVAFELNAETWWQYIDIFVNNTFGSRNIAEAHGGVLSEINSRYPVLSGVLGGEIWGGAFLSEELFNAATEEVPGFISTLLRNEKGIRDTRLLKYYKKSKIDFPANYKSRDLYLVARRGRHYFAVKTLGERFSYIEPFMDNQLIDFIYSLPDEWRLNYRLYKEKRCYLNFFQNISLKFHGREAVLR